MGAIFFWKFSPASVLAFFDVGLTLLQRYIKNNKVFVRLVIRTNVFPLGKPFLWNKEALSYPLEYKRTLWIFLLAEEEGFELYR